MMHKAWRSTEEVPYFFFFRLSIKFEGHMDRKIIDDFNPILSKITRLVTAITESLRFALLYFEISSFGLIWSVRIDSGSGLAKKQVNHLLNQW